LTEQTATENRRGDETQLKAHTVMRRVEFEARLFEEFNMSSVHLIGTEGQAEISKI
jgi:hypothetical protein